MSSSPSPSLWWTWPYPKTFPKALLKRYPDFIDPASWRRGSNRGRIARCQGPDCVKEYVTISKDHYYCCRECTSATLVYYHRHHHLPRPPIFEADLLSYVRPQNAWKLEAAQLRAEAEEWKVQHGRTGQDVHPPGAGSKRGESEGSGED